MRALSLALLNILHYVASNVLDRNPPLPDHRSLISHEINSNNTEFGPNVDVDVKIKINAPGQTVKLGFDLDINTEIKQDQQDNEDNCNEECPLVYDPVCGSDGKLYTNECFLRVINCMNDLVVTVEHDQSFCLDPFQDDLSLYNITTAPYRRIPKPEASFTKYDPKYKKWGDCPIVTPPADGGIETCSSDQTCPPFMRCCRTDAGRECVVSEVNFLSTGCSGCSLGIHFDTSVFTPMNMSSIRSFLWDFLKPIVSESTDLFVTLGDLYTSSVSQNIQDLKQLRDSINTLSAAPQSNPDNWYNPFLFNKRKIVFIGTFNQQDSMEKLNNLKHFKSILDTKVCLIVVGESTITDDEFEEITTDCFYKINSYENLDTVSNTLNNDLVTNECTCGSDTPFTDMKEIGEACSSDGECYSSKCGTSNQCTVPDCPAVTSFRYFLSQFSREESLDYLKSVQTLNNAIMDKNIKPDSKPYLTSDSVYDYYPLSPNYVYQNVLSDGCCADGLFQCAANGICLYGESLCDGVEDCADGEDEDSSVCSSITCPPKHFQCDSGQCIMEEKKCDGVQDCGDGSDEQCSTVVDCPSNRGFFCGSGECISVLKACDYSTDCANMDDEKDCSCYGYKCGSGECIPKKYLCDGVPDCKSGEDEGDSCLSLGCENFDEDDQFLCQSGRCISKLLMCNGIADCDDGSDEAANVCSECFGFQCGSGECINQKQVCDNRVDCSDSSDEFCHFDGVSILCDGVVDMYDGSDENSCSEATCPEDRPYFCSEGKCIEDSKVCNGIDDCDGGSDEYNCSSVMCDQHQHLCANGQCVSKSSKHAVCDGIKDCFDKSDESNCLSITCPSKQFQCNDGVCIDEDEVCDLFPHCIDGSDELESLCSRASCPGLNQTLCSSGQCINNQEYNQCDGIHDCTDGSDEKDCDACSDGASTCSSGGCYQSQLECDGYHDCVDGSDEASCIPSECSVDEFKCESGECVDEYSICDGYFDCKDGSDEHQCGDYTCKPDQFRCLSDDSCIPIYSKCDDQIDCPDGSDELDCYNSPCQVNEFQCTSGLCIGMDRKCDGVLDCPMEDDEHCMNATCSDASLHQCPHTGQCLPASYKCDKYFDCPDASDEVHCYDP